MRIFAINSNNKNIYNIKPHNSFKFSFSLSFCGNDSFVSETSNKYKKRYEKLEKAIKDDDFKENILKSVNKDNIELAELMIRNKDFPKDLISTILSTTSKRNLETGKMLLSEKKIEPCFIPKILESTSIFNAPFVKPMIETLDLPYPLIPGILLAIRKDNVELFEEMIGNPDFPKTYIKDILNASGEENIDLAKIMVQDKDFPKNIVLNILNVIKDENHKAAEIMIKDPDFDRDDIWRVLFMVNKENSELVVDMLSDKNFPKDNIRSIVQYLNSQNLELGRTLISDPVFPKNLLPKVLEKTNSKNINLLSDLCLNNKEILSQLNDEGYEIRLKILQNTDDAEFLAEKITENVKDDDNSPYQIKDIVRLNKNGVILKSKCEVFDLEDDKDDENDEILERTTTQNGKYFCDSFYKPNVLGGNILKMELRVIYGKNSPLYVQKTTASDISEGAYDTITYNLAQCDKNIEGVLSAIKEKGADRSEKILEEIKKAGIKPWDFAKTVKNPDGTITHIEKFQKGDLHTKRKYEANDDETKTSLDYVISNSLGKKLLDVHRTFELKGDKSITTLNGKTYTAEFDDSCMAVWIKYDGKYRNIHFLDKTRHEKDEYREKLWNLIKKTPADLLLSLDDIDLIQYTNFAYWDYRTGGRIGTNDKLSNFTHEMGHYLDDTKRCQYTPNILEETDFSANDHKKGFISYNPELIRIYTEETENLKRKMSDFEQKNISYFSQTGGSSETGLSEIVAETNLLCTTQEKTGLQTRALYLMRHFPKTISKAAELLGYVNETLAVKNSLQTRNYVIVQTHIRL